MMNKIKQRHNTELQLNIQLNKKQLLAISQNVNPSINIYQLQEAVRLKNVFGDINAESAHVVHHTMDSVGSRDQKGPEFYNLSYRGILSKFDQEPEIHRNNIFKKQKQWPTYLFDLNNALAASDPENSLNSPTDSELDEEKGDELDTKFSIRLTKKERFPTVNRGKIQKYYSRVHMLFGLHNESDQPLQFPQYLVQDRAVEKHIKILTQTWKTEMEQNHHMTTIQNACQRIEPIRASTLDFTIWYTTKELLANIAILLKYGCPGQLGRLNFIQRDEATRAIMLYNEPLRIGNLNLNNELGNELGYFITRFIETEMLILTEGIHLSRKRISQLEEEVKDFADETEIENEICVQNLDNNWLFPISEAYDPQLNKDLNGEQTLTFKVKYKSNDRTLGKKGKRFSIAHFVGTLRTTAYMQDLISQEFKNDKYQECLTLLIGVSPKTTTKQANKTVTLEDPFSRFRTSKQNDIVRLANEPNSCLITAINTSLSQNFFQSKRQYNRVVQLCRRKPLDECDDEYAKLWTIHCLVAKVEYQPMLKIRWLGLDMVGTLNRSHIENMVHLNTTLSGYINSLKLDPQQWTIVAIVRHWTAKIPGKRELNHAYVFRKDAHNWQRADDAEPAWIDLDKQDQEWLRTISHIDCYVWEESCTTAYPTQLNCQKTTLQAVARQLGIEIPNWIYEEPRPKDMKRCNCVRHKNIQTQKKKRVLKREDKEVQEEVARGAKLRTGLNSNNNNNNIKQ